MRRAAATLKEIRERPGTARASMPFEIIHEIGAAFHSMGRTHRPIPMGSRTSRRDSKKLRTLFKAMEETTFLLVRNGPAFSRRTGAREAVRRLRQRLDPMLHGGPNRLLFSEVPAVDLLPDFVRRRLSQAFGFHAVPFRSDRSSRVPLDRKDPQPIGRHNVGVDSSFSRTTATSDPDGKRAHSFLNRQHRPIVGSRISLSKCEFRRGPSPLRRVSLGRDPRRRNGRPRSRCRLHFRSSSPTERGDATPFHGPRSGRKRPSTKRSISYTRFIPMTFWALAVFPFKTSTEISTLPARNRNCVPATRLSSPRSPRKTSCAD